MKSRIEAFFPLQGESQAKMNCGWIGAEKMGLHFGAERLSFTRTGIEVT